MAVKRGRLLHEFLKRMLPVSIVFLGAPHKGIQGLSQNTIGAPFPVKTLTSS